MAVVCCGHELGVRGGRLYVKVVSVSKVSFEWPVARS